MASHLVAAINGAAEVLALHEEGHVDPLLGSLDPAGVYGRGVVSELAPRDLAPQCRDVAKQRASIELSLFLLLRCWGQDGDTPEHRAECCCHTEHQGRPDKNDGHPQGQGNIAQVIAQIGHRTYEMMYFQKLHSARFHLREQSLILVNISESDAHKTGQGEHRRAFLANTT